MTIVQWWLTKLLKGASSVTWGSATLSPHRLLTGGLSEVEIRALKICQSGSILTIFQV